MPGDFLPGARAGNQRADVDHGHFRERGQRSGCHESLLGERCQSFQFPREFHHIARPPPREAVACWQHAQIDRPAAQDKSLRIARVSVKSRVRAGRGPIHRGNPPRRRHSFDRAVWRTKEPEDAHDICRRHREFSDYLLRIHARSWRPPRTWTVLLCVPLGVAALVSTLRQPRFS